MISPDCIPQFYKEHMGTINTVGIYIGYTMIRHLPAPGQKISVYAYFYEVLDSLIATPMFQKFQAMQPKAPVVPPAV